MFQIHQPAEHVGLERRRKGRQQVARPFRRQVRQHQGDGPGVFSVEQLGQAFVARLAEKVERRRCAFGRGQALLRPGGSVAGRPASSRPLQAAGLEPVQFNAARMRRGHQRPDPPKLLDHADLFLAVDLADIQHGLPHEFGLLPAEPFQ